MQIMCLETLTVSLPTRLMPTSAFSAEQTRTNTAGVVYNKLLVKTSEFKNSHVLVPDRQRLQIEFDEANVARYQVS
jgi:hypothetical protein